MTTQTTATAEIERWLRIRVCFFTNFLLLRQRRRVLIRCQAKFLT